MKPLRIWKINWRRHCQKGNSINLACINPLAGKVRGFFYYGFLDHIEILLLLTSRVFLSNLNMHDR